MSLGTPHYMSPEQAMGEREITARSDVYALGCVTYEMLIGDPPFTGSTAQAIIAKVMTEKPASLQRQRERVPDAVEDAVLTALEKLPADRFASAAEFAEALRGASGTTRTRISAATRAGRAPRSRLRDPVVLGLGAIAVAAALLAAWSRRTAPGAPAPVVRFTLPAAPSGRTSSLGYNSLAVSLDGRSLVYLGQGDGHRQQLMFRAMDDPGRGRCRGPRTPATRSSRPTADGSPSFAATSSTRSPSRPGAAAARNGAGHVQRVQLVVVRSARGFRQHGVVRHTRGRWTGPPAE